MNALQQVRRAGSIRLSHAGPSRPTMHAMPSHPTRTLQSSITLRKWPSGGCLWRCMTACGTTGAAFCPWHATTVGWLREGGLKLRGCCVCVACFARNGRWEWPTGFLGTADVACAQLVPCIAAPAPADPNSGGSSFSMLLGQAPHLDKQYTIFGLVSCAMLRCAVLICAAPHARVSV